MTLNATRSNVCNKCISGVLGPNFSPLHLQFSVTGHIETSASNDPIMTLDTIKVHHICY